MRRMRASRRLGQAAAPPFSPLPRDKERAALHILHPVPMDQAAVEPASTAQWPSPCSTEPLAANEQNPFARLARLPPGLPPCISPSRFWYTPSSGLFTKNMRTAIRLLAVFTIGALLAPTARWASVRVQTEACACPPAACMCSGHRHTPGHTPACNMKDGGRCGIGSQDDYLSSALTTLNYMPTEYHWANPPAPWRFNHNLPDAIPLPSHSGFPTSLPVRLYNCRYAIDACRLRAGASRSIGRPKVKDP